MPSDIVILCTIVPSSVLQLNGQYCVFAIGDPWKSIS